MAVVPLSDASRPLARFPLVTVLILVANILGFGFELAAGEGFVVRWSVIPAHIVSGHQLITLMTAMYLHGSWLDRKSVV